MKLNLEVLRNGFLGLTPEVGANLLQACTVCLDNFNHSSGVSFQVNGDFQKEFALEWTSEVDEIIKRNWNDLQEATEYGATAIAILVTAKNTKCQAIERSKKGTGFDYWLGQEDELEIFNYKERLEISGILTESPSNTIENRINQKKSQVTKSDNTGLNAHICVTEFSTPKCAYYLI